MSPRLTDDQYRAAVMKEEALLVLVLRAAEMTGWRAYHVRNSRAAVIQGPGAEGFPDLVLTNGQRVMFRELKSRLGKLRPEQAEWLMSLAAAGCDAGVWRPQDWLAGDIIRQLGDEP